MRAARVRVGLVLGPHTPIRVRIRPLSSSVPTPSPRRAPPDIPRPACAQTSVDDAQTPAVSVKPDADTDLEQEKPRKRLGRPPGSPNKTPPAPPPATSTRASVSPEAIWTGRSLDEGGESRALPPDDMLQDALAQLLVTFQPQTQYRAAYASSGSALIEPTLALYCPIEGGDYVIDDTVKELASRVNSDVIVIDAVQLAAGEYGSFGKAASIINFPHNPLHFPPAPSANSRSPSGDPDADEDDADEDDTDTDTQRLTFGNVSAVAVPVRALRLRSPNPFAPATSSDTSSSTSTARSPSIAQSELKYFFESIINAQVPSSSSSGPHPRPRIIYLKDFSLLAPSAYMWYPALLSAIRSRRQGPILRPSNPTPYPTTLILGVSPSLVPAFSGPLAPVSPGSGLISILMGQHAARVSPTPTRGDSNHEIEERATRLRDRLKRWSRTGSVLDELPPFISPSHRSTPGPTGFMSANGFTRLFGAHPSTTGDRVREETSNGDLSVGTGNKSGYFRVCGVVPAVRDEVREKSVRRSRRAEVNALVVRMAVGAVGGKVLASNAAPPAVTTAKPSKSKKDAEEKDKEKDKSKDPATAGLQPGDVSPTDKMTDDLSRKLLDWSAARRLADRALAHAVLSGSSATEQAGAQGEVAPTQDQDEGSGGGLPLATPVSLDALKNVWDAVRLSLGYGDKLPDSIAPPPSDTVAAPSPAASLASTPAASSPPSSSSAPPPSSSASSSSPKWSGIGSPREPVPWIDAALAPPEVASSAAGTTPEAGKADDVVEKLKNDPELDVHEERLLGCIVNAAELQTTFSQVHLPDSTIDSVRTLVSLPLLYPAAFRSGILAQHAMTGALLFGPPGTGKTLLARALAKESGARMMVVKPSDVMDMYVGEGEKLVRSVFSLARRLSPCIVFLDEIDALLGARSSRDTGGAASAHRGLVTEFMQEMDGLRSSTSSNIVVIGATNRPFDLDDAVLRRLPRRLLIDLPGSAEREEILRIMLKGEDLAEDVDIKDLASKTDGFSGSDLKNLVVAAALDAVKEKVLLPWRTRSDAEKGRGVEKTTNVSSAVAAKLATNSSSSPASMALEALEASILATAQTPAPAPATESNPTGQPTSPAKSEPSQLSSDPAFTPSRKLTNYHFARALKEITPSASEALGTLADLRKWNTEFGGGDRKKSNKAWGGRFGFGGSGKRPDGEGTGRVAGVVDER